MAFSNHQSSFRREAFKLAAVQNIPKVLLLRPLIGPSVLRWGSEDGRTYMTFDCNSLSSFLPWRQFLATLGNADFAVL